MSGNLVLPTGLHIKMVVGPRCPCGDRKTTDNYAVPGYLRLCQSRKRCSCLPRPSQRSEIQHPLPRPIGLQLNGFPSCLLDCSMTTPNGSRSCCEHSTSTSSSLTASSHSGVSSSASDTSFLSLSHSSFSTLVNFSLRTLLKYPLSLLLWNKVMTHCPFSVAARASWCDSSPVKSKSASTPFRTLCPLPALTPTVRIWMSSTCFPCYIPYQRCTLL